jgi:hypothetical protein
MKTKSTQKSNEGFFLTLIKFAMQIIKFFTKKTDNKTNQFKIIQIENAKKELRKALMEGRIGDVKYWSEKIKLLSNMVVILFSLSMVGCFNTKPNIEIQTLVIGERIIKVYPRDVVEIPELISPSKQWYLIDDEGLYQWIDIDLNNK